MVKINYNGSKFIGEHPDSLDRLYELLGAEPLRRDYKSFSCESERYPGCVQFYGNFENISHPFSIITDETEAISKLSRLIADNATAFN
jgi:hypothetical protein